MWRILVLKYPREPRIQGPSLPPDVVSSMHRCEQAKWYLSCYDASEYEYGIIKQNDRNWEMSRKHRKHRKICSNMHQFTVDDSFHLPHVLDIPAAYMRFRAKKCEKYENVLKVVLNDCAAVVLEYL
jgi:hypothetical protein